MTVISKSPLRTFSLHYKPIFMNINIFKDFSKNSNPDLFLILKISIQFFVQLLTRMTSSDGMMLKMIRHVYVRLQLAGPEDPSMPLSCAGSQWQIGFSRQKSRQMIRKGTGKSMKLTALNLHKVGLHTSDRLLLEAVREVKVVCSLRDLNQQP